MRSVTGLAHVPRGRTRIAASGGAAGSNTTAASTASASASAVPLGGMPQGLVDALQEVQ
jgi:hypothetical protein